jgi:hypothetical protein
MVISRLPLFVAGGLLAAAALSTQWGERQDVAELSAETVEAREPGPLMRLVPGAVYTPLRTSAALESNASRPNVAESSAARTIVREQALLVLGAEGEAVGAARLELERGGVRAVFSDAAGRARLSITKESAGARVRVRAEGYSDQVVELDAQQSDPLVVTLERGGSFSGDVHWSNGRAAAAGTVVIAWQEQQRPTLDEVLRVRDGGYSQALRVARTDAHGRFHFDGVSSSAAYELGAIYEGGLALRRERQVHAGDGNLRLELRRVLGAALELVDADGGAPRASDGLFAGTAMWDPSDGRLAPCGLPEDAVEMAWLGGAELHRAADVGRDQYLLLYELLGDAPAAEAESSFSIQVPGYRPIWTRFELEPVSSELRVRQLPLERVAERWAPFEFALEGVDGWFAERTRAEDSPFAVLRLRDLDSSADFEAALRPTRDGRWHFDAIPCGRYELSITLRDWSSVIPGASEAPLVVDIGEHGGVASLALEGRGAGEVLVSQADGSDYEGELVLCVKQGDPIRYLRFKRAPYVLGGLEEGEYEVSVASLGAQLTKEPTSSSLLLAADTVSVCLIHLP